MKTESHNELFAEQGVMLRKGFICKLQDKASCYKQELSVSCKNDVMNT